MNSFINEIRQGWRVFRKNSLVGITAILTMAVGIGCVTAVFSVIKAVLLNPLPYPDAHRLVTIWRVPTAKLDEFWVTSLPEARDWREANSSLTELAPFTERDYTLLGTDQPVNIHGISASSNLFHLLSCAPMIGRTFTPGEDEFGSLNGSNPVVLSESLWKREFGADPSIPGRQIQLNGESYTVIGVMPSSFAFPVGVTVDLWTTLAEFHKRNFRVAPASQQRDVLQFEVVAKLKPGVTLKTAERDLKTIETGLARKYPQYTRDISVRVLPAITWVAGLDYGGTLWAFMVAVSCVLLVAIVNIMVLQLAKQSTRRSETAIRLVLGATRFAIFRQLLAEGIILAFLGGAGGVGLAYMSITLLKRIVPQDVPRLGEAGLDTSVLLFTLITTALASVIFTIGPLIQTADMDISLLKQGNNREASRGLKGKQLLGSLMIVEVSLTVFLFTSASLLLLSVQKAHRMDLGFQDTNILTFQLSLPQARYDPAAQSRFFNTLLAQIQELPSVERASSATAPPMTGNTVDVGVIVPGQKSRGNIQASVSAVQPGYFGLLHIPVRGREFTPDDSVTGQPVVIINESLARRAFGHADAIGKQLEPTVPAPDGVYKVRTVIAVTANVKSEDPWRESGPAVYVPEAQAPFNSMVFLVHTSASPLMLTDSIRREVKMLDRTIPVSKVKTLNEYVRDKLLIPEFSSLLLSLFASIALLLAMVVVYAVVAYSVSQRKREMSIRMALGATPGAVLRIIVRQTMVLVLMGLAIGTGASVMAGRILRGTFSMVVAANPIALLISLLLVLLATLMACFLPARKIAMARRLHILNQE